MKLCKLIVEQLEIKIYNQLYKMFRQELLVHQELWTFQDQELNIIQE